MDIATFPIDIQLLVQTLLYFASVLAGFSTAVLCGVTQNRFQGNCFLYVSGDWKNMTYIDLQFGNSGACNFVIYGTVFCCIVYPLAMGCYYIYGVYTSRNDRTIASQMWVMPFILANTGVAFVVFIISCILGVGLTQTCATLTAPRPTMYPGEYYQQFSKCQDAQWYDWQSEYRGLAFNFGAFHTHYAVAQSASWINLLFWIIQIVLGGIRFYRNRKERAAESYVGDIATPDDKPIGNVDPTA